MEADGHRETNMQEEQCTAPGNRPRSMKAEEVDKSKGSGHKWRKAFITKWKDGITRSLVLQVSPQLSRRIYLVGNHLRLDATEFLIIKPLTEVEDFLCSFINY